MDYKEKYEQALERAKKLQETCDSQAVVGWCEYIFPELKELWDERIKREILELVSIAGNGNQFEEIKDWLEKQGKQKVSDSSQTCKMETLMTLDEAIEHCKGKSCDNTLCSKEHKQLAEWLTELKGYRVSVTRETQNPADKLEPKFHEGNWVLNNVCPPVQIASIKGSMYIFTEGDAMPVSFVDENYHLWTIEDAKDGDILAINWYEGDDSWEKIIIFKKYHNKGVKGLYSMPCVEGYGNTFKNGKLAFQEEVPYYSETWTANLHPATKEQRDTLIKAMANAGYTFDFEKKELKKKLDPDKVIAWLVGNICDFEYYVKRFKQDFGL